MEDSKALPWYKRWFGGIGWKDYLSAVPFCIGFLLMPLLPTAGIYYVARQGQAPLVLLLLLFLAFGYPVLRVKRYRAAWWVGTLIGVGSLFGLAVTNVVVGRFFGFYTFLTWIIAIAFLVLNWKKFRWWTFVVVAVVVLIHMVPMGFGRTVSMALAMGLMALYFRLPDRDNFPRFPLVISVIMAMLIAHGVTFYFDVGGRAEVRNHPAARKVFEYEGQRRGWVRALGGNTRFLTPTCDGKEFMVGNKFTFRSGLTFIDPATGKNRRIPMTGGTTDNVALDCAANMIYVGNMGRNEIMVYDPNRLKRPIKREGMDGVRVGLLRLDRRMDRLYVATSNTNMLHVLRASTLADSGAGVTLGNSVTDMVIDYYHGHDVVAVTMGGELVRIAGDTGQVEKKAPVGFGLLIYNLALDSEGRRLFVTSLFGRQLQAFDADTFEPQTMVPLFKGGRYMQFDARRDLVYVGNFFAGTITAYASQSLESVWTMKVGRRVRYLTLDTLRDQLCFTSQQGGYCLWLDKLSPAPAPTPAPPPIATPEPAPTDEASPASEETSPATEEAPSAPTESPASTIE
ncbi:MAG TPA: hypothetical protein PKW95_09330 [bacterium]|nr:hypothetical protein [bacterium]